MVEGRLPYQKLVSQHSQTPEIHRHVVLSAFEDFRCGIVESAAVCFSPFIADCRPTKVTKLTGPMRHNYIFWLNVSVSNAVLMHVNDAFGDFLDFFGCVCVFQLLAFLEHRV